MLDGQDPKPGALQTLSVLSVVSTYGKPPSGGHPYLAVNMQANGVKTWIRFGSQFGASLSSSIILGHCIFVIFFNFVFFFLVMVKYKILF